MQTSLGKSLIAAGALLLCGATSAQAENQTVLILDGSYFPAFINTAVGDTVTFTNESGQSHTITGPDDIWTSGSIGSSSSFVLNVVADMPTSFTGEWSNGAVADGGLILP